jgi:hypothetical protein
MESDLVQMRAEKMAPRSMKSLKGTCYYAISRSWEMLKCQGNCAASKKYRNATSGSEGGRAYLVREQLTESEIDKANGTG